MSSPVIKTEKLAKSFGGTRVLKDVSLQIPEGAIVGLIGTNGSGKSTLIKCLLGLLRRTSGSATIMGDDVWELSEATKAKLGYVPQEVKPYPWMTSSQILKYTAAFYSGWNHTWADQLIQRWEIPLSTKVSHLSAGQLQRLGLVLAMGHQPSLMILDEPVASLDPVGRREFLRSLLDLTTDFERTILFSTHITSDLERIASHVAILQDGVITHFEELDSIKERFKRIRIRSGQALPESFAVRGAIRTVVDGSQALVAVPDVDHHLVQQLKDDWNAEVAIEDLNLEEIFMELHDA